MEAAMAGTLRAASVGLVALASLGASPAWAQSTCTAELAPSTRDLAHCVRTIAAEGTITLRPGTHRVANLVIDRSMNLVAEDPSDTRVAHALSGTPLLDPSLVTTGGLQDDVTLFFVVGDDTRVTVEGVEIRPPIGVDQSLLTGFLRGRGFVIDGASLTLRDVRLLPWDEPALGDTLVVLSEVAGAEPDPTGPITANRKGGVLAYAEGGATLSLVDSNVRGLRARTLVGTAVFATGVGTQVSVRGSSVIEQVESLAGAIAAIQGAAVEIGPSSAGTSPILRRLGGRLGGAVFVAGAALKVEDGRFDDNGLARTRPDWAVTYGGSIAGIGGSTIRIDDGSFDGGRATYGGGIAALGARLDLLGGTFRDGQAAHGAHVFVGPDGTRRGAAAIRDVTFIGGRASLVAQERAAPERLVFARGGSLFAGGSSVEVEGCTFQDNRAEGEGIGGAVDLVDTSAQILGVTFFRNRAGTGGALSGLSAPVEVIGGSFDHNEASRSGGAVAVLGGSLIASGAEFRHNVGGRGGAIFGATAADIRVSDSIFVDNSAEVGGALRAIAGDLRVVGSSFDDNRSSDDLGGHIAALSGEIEEGGRIVRGAVRVEGSTFRGGSGVRGGAISANAATVSLIDLDIEGAVAALSGGGIFIEQAESVELDRIALRDTRAGTAGGGVLLQGVGSAVLRDVSAHDTRSEVGGGIALDQVAEARLIRPVSCGTRAAQGSAMSLRMVGSSAAGTARIDNALLYGVDGESAELLYAVGSDVAVSQAALLGGVGPAVVSDGASLALDRSLIGWLAPTAAAPLVSEGTGSISFTDGAVFLPAWDPDRGGDPVALGLPAQTLVGQPRLRSITLDPIDDPDRMPACDPDRLHEHLHPRPLSPTLLDGYPAQESDTLVGIFGGPERFAEPWRTDADDDGVPWIFDCDDDNPEIGDRLVQYVDGDGDGVGGDLWPGDDCHLVPGNVEVGGDCDDDDPRVAAVCGDIIGFYGMRCQAAPGSTLPWALLLSIAWLARRRRIG